MRRIGIAVRVLLVIALVGLPAGVPAEGADDGLVAEWHFDEGSGSVAADSSGNGNDGVIHGATWVEGKYGKALSFDGKDDYVDFGNDASLNVEYITLEAWVNLQTWDEGGGLICKGTGAGGEVWCIDVKNNKFRLFFWKVGKGYTLDSLVIPNGWMHIVATYDGYFMRFYVNGVEKNSKALNLGVLDTNAHIASLGSRQHRTADYNLNTNGIIDEVRIYNRALTADEIKTHYEGKQTALSLTKSASPHSIKQGQTTTVILTVKNTGSTEITDIEITDTILSDLTFVSGETSKTYTSLRPKDSREFQYVLQLNDAGTFNLDPATTTYSDEEGNYHTAKSKTATITVIPSIDQSTTPQTTKNPSTEISTASVHLHGEKTDVVLGEDILLKLSAVNKITKPTMTLQVILIPPSGMSVTSADFVESGAGLYTSTYVIEPGIGRDIEVGIRSNQVGEFVVNGEVIYYFGDDKENAEEHLLSLPITVRASPTPTPTPTPTPKPSPGFEAVLAAAGVLLVALLIKRRRTG